MNTSFVTFEFHSFICGTSLYYFISTDKTINNILYNIKGHIPYHSTDNNIKYKNYSL